MPPTTVQVDTPQLSTPPPGNGKDVCAAARGIALSSAIARMKRKTEANALNLRSIIAGPQHPSGLRSGIALAVADRFASHNCRKATAASFQLVAVRQNSHISWA